MSSVPLDLQRRCEQRWAARFQRPVEPTATLGAGPNTTRCAFTASSSRPVASEISRVTLAERSLQRGLSGANAESGGSGRDRPAEP